MKNKILWFISLVLYLQTQILLVNLWLFPELINLALLSGTITVLYIIFYQLWESK